LYETLRQVGGDVNLDTVLLWEPRIIRVRTRNEDTSIRKKNSFRMIHASNGTGRKDGEPSIDRESGVIKNGIEVWIIGLTPASHSVVSTV
jgi:hypothetical protein